MVFYAPLARLDPAQSRLKVQANLLFHQKWLVYGDFAEKKQNRWNFEVTLRKV